MKFGSCARMQDKEAEISARGTPVGFNLCVSCSSFSQLWALRLFDKAADS